MSAKDRDEELIQQVRSVVDASPLAEGMRAIHEMYASMRDAGFTETQTLRVIAYGILGHPRDENGSFS